eukprot:TRINITY_DN1771_c0_g5_i1.p1 TRINITY_DN1771_c0_g5~~TRINITY_DN1771_c0_g5_i1.p1  ORF type:complete len:257 (+),score=71.19 TRINITY_DN1771_c0_g5_i1:83-853(+)
MKYILESFSDSDNVSGKKKKKKNTKEKEKEKKNKSKSKENEGENVEEEFEEDGEDILQRLTVSKEGKGRLYYRLGLKYIPDNLILKPADYGFTITRQYEYVDDPGDVWKEELEQEDQSGSETDKPHIWHVKVGSRVRVIINVVVTTTRYHVAIVDKLPAGLESVNEALLGQMGHVPERPQTVPKLWKTQWGNHVNFRDERSEKFAFYLLTGQYSWAYIARATSKGSYVVPPAKAEEMYSPEIFGRTATENLIVEDK